MNQPITQQQLKDLIKYNSRTGVMTWRKRNGTKIKSGDVAGYIEKRSGNKTNYRCITILGTKYQAARLAVLYKTGQMPVGVVKYKDGNTLNLAWSNLIYSLAWSKVPIHRDIFSDKDIKEIFSAQVKFGSDVPKEQITTIAPTQPSLLSWFKSLIGR